MRIGIPAFYLVIVFGSGIQLHFNAYELIIEIISHLFLRKNNSAHIHAEAAPGGKTIH